MKVHHAMPASRRGGGPSAVAIGNFDGVHKGHRATIRRLHAAAQKVGASPTVLTFHPHPQQVLRGLAPKSLVTLERKFELLDQAGIEHVWVIPFSHEFSRLEPEEFIEKTLVKHLQTQAVVVGADFRFGRFARGDLTMLKSFGARLGFTVSGARIAELRGRRISSTAIRHALLEGDLEWATAALGRAYELEGRIVTGKGRGKGLGYPTANLAVKDESSALLKKGIYAGYVMLGEVKHPAAISVGVNPTFGTNALSIEAFLLDHDEELYGRSCRFIFVKRIRDEKKFRSPAALARAITDDVTAAREILS
ncbi:MAG: bifunctional riboflavin kinase/FAD synthetase [Actinomycetota bacterium]